MSQEEEDLSKKGRTTTTVQVSRPLDLAITNFAAKHGITKSEAADRIFGVLYPDGNIPEAAPPIAPGAEEEGEEEPGDITEASVPETDEVGDILTETAKNLSTVKTINALSKSLEGGKEQEKPWHLTAEEAFEMRKIEKMFGSGDSQQRMDIGATLQNFQRSIIAEMQRLLAEKETARAAEERDFYKMKVEEREKAEQRAAEIEGAMAPIREMVTAFDEKLEAFRAELKPESKQAPTSAELEAIRTLGTNIQQAIVELKPKAGGSKTEELTNYLDGLGTIVDKINEWGKKGRPEIAGEFDWKTAAISTFGEVTGEAIKAFRDVEVGKSEEKTSEGAPPVASQVIERRVYNYALRKIAAGETTVDPYKAGEELGLTANQVWGAIESLKKKGALKAPQVTQSGRQEEQKEEAREEANSLVEG